MGRLPLDSLRSSRAIFLIEISMEHGKLNFVERDDSIFAGAIFMSNRETKLECLQRKLFGLPLSKSKFLKQVKAGMMLFLFEHEERKLYGVFEATSDGALNIIPDAFRSTGQSYPAQILFKRIWMCKPLCEDEFCSAIEENYYSPNKFHFGLSYKQVIKLIHLFYSRKINIKQYKGLVGIPNKIIEKFENTAAEEVSLTETETYFKYRSDEYGSEGKREVRRQLALPEVSLDPPMLCKRPASTTSMLHTVNLPPLSYPHNSYPENLNSQRCSVCLSHDHSTFHHFSIGKQPSTTSEIEYEPLPLRSIGKQPSTTSEIEYEPLPLRSIGKQPSTTSEMEYEPLPLRSCYMPNLDNMMAPNLISPNRHSSPDNVARELRFSDPAMIPRMAMIQKDAFTSSPVMNNSRPQTEIVQRSCASGAQPNQVFEFSEYIPLVEESRHKLDNRENHSSSLQNSEYMPSTRLNSYIPSTSKETSKYFYSADGYSDDNALKTYRRAEADEYNAVGRILYADSDLSRNSVFSRLSRHQNICNDETPEPSCGEPTGGLSLDHFLNILSTRRNLWSAMEASKQSMEWNRHEQFGCTASTARFHHRSGHRNKITRLPVQPVERSEIDQHDDNGITDAEHVGFPASSDSDLSNDVLDEESFEIPFYNFRRRNTSQKYEVQDYSNKYSDICGSEAKLMESKRRRIVRPSLYDKCIKIVKAEAEVKTYAQSKERTEVETSAQVILESKNESKVSVVDSFLDRVVPGLQTVRKCEPVGESLEQNHVTSMDESLDYIPID